MKVDSFSKASMRSGIRLGAVLILAAALQPLSISAQEAAGVPSPDDTAHAVGSLRTINTGEAYYAREYKKGYSATLKDLGVPPEGVKPSPSAAGVVDNTLTGGKKSNYVFTYKASAPDAGGNINAYTVTASPVKWEKDVKSFFTDQTAVIRWTDQNRAPKASDPAVQ